MLQKVTRSLYVIACVVASAMLLDAAALSLPSPLMRTSTASANCVRAMYAPICFKVMVKGQVLEAYGLVGGDEHTPSLWSFMRFSCVVIFVSGMNAPSATSFSSLSSSDGTEVTER